MINFFSVIITFYLLVSTYPVASKLVKHVFEVKYFSGTPDGVFKEKILGINNQFPGPLIEADLGDILQIDVVNNIQDGQNTTIHWHGIHQKGSLCEDGTSQISQCPLRNGQTQRYVFTLHQAGTYWYHSHAHSQYTEGLWGALIVHNKPEVYTYDEEILITLNDWYHRTAKENEEWHLSPISQGVPPYPDSAMINGLGRSNCTIAKLLNQTCDEKKQTRPVFRVQRDKTYRIRVINTSAVAAFNFSIDGHRLETIEVDGIDVAKPVLVDIVPIAAAQRYSFLVKLNTSLDRYLIRANLRTESLMLIKGENINPYPEALLGEATAVLEFANDPQTNSTLVAIGSEHFSYLEEVPRMTTVDPEYLKEHTLSPFGDNYAPPYFDKEFLLDVYFEEDHENIRRGSFNRTPFVLPENKPLLMAVLDGDPIFEEAMTLHIEYMSVIQIVINNSFAGPHPFHLHGHHFWVMGTGSLHDGAYDPSIHNLTLTGAKRDTFLVEEGSWGVIRFIADNPGVWTFHCHIDWHNLSGMSLIFVEALEIARSTIKVTDEAKRVCGNAYQNITKTTPNYSDSTTYASSDYNKPQFDVTLFIFIGFLMNNRLIDYSLT